jgi:flagellin-like protein
VPPAVGDNVEMSDDAPVAEQVGLPVPAGPRPEASIVAVLMLLAFAVSLAPDRGP